jgi:hypothetical protein
VSLISGYLTALHQLLILISAYDIYGMNDQRVSYVSVVDGLPVQSLAALLCS